MAVVTVFIFRQCQWCCCYLCLFVCIVYIYMCVPCILLLLQSKVNTCKSYANNAEKCYWNQTKTWKKKTNNNKIQLSYNPWKRWHIAPCNSVCVFLRMYPLYPCFAFATEFIDFYTEETPPADSLFDSLAPAPNYTYNSSLHWTKIKTKPVLQMQQVPSLSQ